MKNRYERIDSTTWRVTHIKTGVSCLVSDKDKPRIVMFDWYPSKGTNNKAPYMRAKIRLHDGSYKSIYMHRLILSFPDSFVDHIDGDELNNRSENLRECNHFQNMANKGRQKGKALPKGVYEYKSRKGVVIGYKAAKVINKKFHHLGLFKSPDEASLAFFKFEREHYNEFAREQ